MGDGHFVMKDEDERMALPPMRPKGWQGMKAFSLEVDREAGIKVTELRRMMGGLAADMRGSGMVILQARPCGLQARLTNCSAPSEGSTVSIDDVAVMHPMYGNCNRIADAMMAAGIRKFEDRSLSIEVSFFTEGDSSGTSVADPEHED